jgi:hypothetical protein
LRWNKGNDAFGRTGEGDGPVQLVGVKEHGAKIDFTGLRTLAKDGLANAQVSLLHELLFFTSVSLNTPTFNYIPSLEGRPKIGLHCSTPGVGCTVGEQACVRRNPPPETSNHNFSAIRPSWDGMCPLCECGKKNI